MAKKLTAREIARVYREAGRRMPDRRHLSRAEEKEFIAKVVADMYPERAESE